MRIWKARMWDSENEEMIPADSLAFETYAPLQDLLATEGVMFFSQLLDKNQTEIFEEDYLEIKDEMSGIFLVICHNGCFGVMAGNDFLPLYKIDWKRMEVIGNSRQNPY